MPHIGELRVDEITPDHVFSVLEPIWLGKNRTARRVRGRIEEVLKFAKAAGHFSGENPARFKDNLDVRLPHPSEEAHVPERPALAQADIAGWFADLHARKGNATRALEFAVLAVARPDAVMGMTWSEVDPNWNLWVVPGSRMKTSRALLVPLSQAALELLRGQGLGEGSPDDLVFPAPSGGVLSDSALSAVMRRMHAAALKAGGGYFDRDAGRPAVPFGLFATFSHWVDERTNFGGEMVEIALGRKVVGFGERDDQLEKRRQMMDAWASFLSGEPGGSAAAICVGVGGKRRLTTRRATGPAISAYTYSDSPCRRRPILVPRTRRGQIGSHRSHAGLFRPFCFTPCWSLCSAVASCGVVSTGAGNATRRPNTG